ncbi:tetratricopeptide repeat protein, putative [Entamoeba invadens IP1]|uniref:Tetratricopeptide repeat protein, putative n=1 Tax=Entamoeba invadens IP1 TaxID=370355 RepID=A0A0A1U6L3_ENTIV|nr:tetratricopeptide repeat protein, putative [Entamoeba invadens IP1]ELP90037.1 tetratricopeptide repeat protein, putative [Entamoeba invadens IP1]|eukprot:XP_004256808.1 tetratricopeptide repeat protein, putative [Entamoeba invadens IP1]
MSTKITTLQLALALLDGKTPAALSESYDFFNGAVTPQYFVSALRGDFSELQKAYPDLTLQNAATLEIPADFRLLVGVALLNGFVRMNFVGPFNLPKDEESEKEIQYLTIDAEQVNAHIQNSLWLHTAAKVFGMLKDKQVPLISWFIGRQATIHQRVLLNPGESLYTRIGLSYRETLKNLEEMKEDLGKVFYERISYKANMELAVGLWASEQYKNVTEELKIICDRYKVFVEMSGAMGSRTKYQEKQTAQLLLKVDRLPHPLSEIKRQKCEQLLKETELDSDSDMLSYASYSGDTAYTPLATYDEAYVLLMCMNKYRKQSRGDLILEEVITYCNRLLRDRIDFSTFLMTVLLKSRYEATVTHFLWRSVNQADEIVKMLESGDDKFLAEERLESIYMTLFPHIFALRKEVGMRMLLMGDPSAAINYFSSLDMKNEIVAAYLSLNEREKAKNLANEMMEKGDRNSELLTLMFELTHDTKYLEECWVNSNKTYLNAQRVLGQYYYNNKDWEKAKEHFELSLKINPLYQRIWYALGITYMQLNNLKEAKNAFLKSVSLDNDDGQSWANLAYVYVTSNNKKEAQIALKEAVRNIRDNYNLWNNLITISIDIQDYRQAISAVVALYDINRSEVSPRVLSMMCDVVLQDIPMHNGETGRAMLGFMKPILKRILNDFKTTDKLYLVAKEGLSLFEQI